MSTTSEARPETPPRRPLVSRWWFWLVVAVVVVAVIVAVGLFSTRGTSGAADPAAASSGGSTAAGGGASASGQASAPAQSRSRGAGSSGSTAGGGAAQDTAALTDGDWTLSDVRAAVTATGTSFTARITNELDEARPGQWTLTVLSDGQRIFDSEAAADEVGAGETVDVTFVGTTTQLPGDPASYTYALRSDG
jgi:hypothetical protein